METWKILLAIVGGVWVVGRLSRRSPNHPVNSIGFQLKIGITEQAASRALIVPSAPDDEHGTLIGYPYDGPGQETAQIQSSLVVGEGGGE
jgi:hypothetical protein